MLLIRLSVQPVNSEPVTFPILKTLHLCKLSYMEEYAVISFPFLF